MHTVFNGWLELLGFFPWIRAWCSQNVRHKTPVRPEKLGEENGHFQTTQKEGSGYPITTQAATAEGCLTRRPNGLVKLLGGAILATAVAGSKQSLHYRITSVMRVSDRVIYRVIAFVLS